MDVMMKIGPALEMMGQGMLGIFAVLGIKSVKTKKPISSFQPLRRA